MKRWFNLGIPAAVLLAGIGPAYAAAVQPPAVPPKGIEGPDIRVVEPKSAATPRIRHCRVDDRLPVEGPDLR
jgi:hypothetical protein